MDREVLVKGMSPGADLCLALMHYVTISKLYNLSRPQCSLLFHNINNCFYFLVKCSVEYVAYRYELLHKH